jgi:hypothetical protein
VSVRELQQYMLDNENGLTKTIVNKNISASLFYQPGELVMRQELKSKGQDTTVDQIDANPGRYAYFILRLSRDNEDFLNEFARRDEVYPVALRFFSERIKDHLLLSFGGRTLKPEDVTLIQSFGISDHTDVMIAYHTDGLQKEENFKVVLSNSEFVPGFYEFKFRAKEIRCIPPLNPLLYEAI